MLAKRQDVYVSNPALLNGKPKETIGRYAKQNNILVPDIYDSRGDARRSGKELIERSESALEYAGASDICQSLIITNKSGKLSWRFPPDLVGCPGDTVLPLLSNKDNMLKALRLVSANSIRVQCNMLELDFEEQMAATSFSLWEDLPGLNLKIAGDSCIKGRYHMTVFDRKNLSCGYAIYETQNTAAHKIWGFKDFFESQGQRIADFYERICSLPNFDPSHRPIIEAQFSDDKIYFLQYHRCRDFEPASFVLDRPKARNEFEATLVRGATLPEGFIAKTTICYSRNYMDGPTGLPREDGASDLDANAFLRNIISLIMAGKRKLQMNIFDSFELESRKIASGHSSFSKLAKPQVSFYIPKSSISLLKDAGYFNQLTSIPSYVAGKDSLRGKDEHMQIDIRITSDGNKAYGEVLESKLATIPVRALGYAVESWRHREKIMHAAQCAINAEKDRLAKFISEL